MKCFLRFAAVSSRFIRPGRTNLKWRGNVWSVRPGAVCKPLWNVPMHSVCGGCCGKSRGATQLCILPGRAIHGRHRKYSLQGVPCRHPQTCGWLHGCMCGVPSGDISTSRWAGGLCVMPFWKALCLHRGHLGIRVRGDGLCNWKVWPSFPNFWNHGYLHRLQWWHLLGNTRHV